MGMYCKSCGKIIEEDDDRLCPQCEEQAKSPITEEQYEAARLQVKEAEYIISCYHTQKSEAFEERMKTNPIIFTDDELVYSRDTLCPCGHGLAYPKECGPNHHWDCSAILKGIADKSITHEAKLPFAFYKIKAEGETMGDTLTTRGVFKPKVPA